MNSLIKITLLSGVVAGLVAFSSGYIALPQRTEKDVPASVPVVEEAGVKVLAFVGPAPVGTVFENLSLGTIDVRRDQLSDQFLIEDEKTFSDYRGRALSRAAVGGVPVTRQDFEPPTAATGSSVRSVLSAGMRAMAIPVSPATAAAGLIIPGDRVDIISTLRVADEELQSTVVVEGSRVLAIDQTMSLTEAESAAPPAATLTVELTPIGATTVALAQSLGTLAVVVSTAERMTDIAPEAATRRTEAMFRPVPTVTVEAVAEEPSPMITIRRALQTEEYRVPRSVSR